MVQDLNQIESGIAGESGRQESKQGHQTYICLPFFDGFLPAPRRKAYKTRAGTGWEGRPPPLVSNLHVQEGLLWRGGCESGQDRTESDSKAKAKIGSGALMHRSEGVDTLPRTLRGSLAPHLIPQQGRGRPIKSDLARVQLPEGDSESIPARVGGRKGLQQEPEDEPAHGVKAQRGKRGLRNCRGEISGSYAIHSVHDSHHLPHTPASVFSTPLCSPTSHTTHTSAALL